jgi:hypothetical protein
VTRWRRVHWPCSKNADDEWDRWNRGSPQIVVFCVVQTHLAHSLCHKL